MKKIQLTSEERAEFDDLMRDVVGDDSKPKATAALTEKLHELLLDAEQAHKPWATRIMEQATRRGLQAVVRTWIRDLVPVGYKTKGGKVVSLSRRAGVKRNGVFQQVLFEDMTPDEARAYLDGVQAQLSAIGALRTSVKRLVDVLDRHPEAKTVGAALKAEGTNVSDVLAGAA